jgi:hypothetical protein
MRSYELSLGCSLYDLCDYPHQMKRESTRADEYSSRSLQLCRRFPSGEKVDEQLDILLAVGPSTFPHSC